MVLFLLSSVFLAQASLGMVPIRRMSSDTSRPRCPPQHQRSFFGFPADCVHSHSLLHISVCCVIRVHSCLLGFQEKWRIAALTTAATVVLALLDLLGGTWWSGRLRHSLGDFHHAPSPTQPNAGSESVDPQVPASSGWDFAPLTSLNIVPFALFGVLIGLLYAVKIFVSRWLHRENEKRSKLMMRVREMVRWSIDEQALVRWVATQVHLS